MEYTTEEQLNVLIKNVTEEFSAFLADADKSFSLAKSEDKPMKDESKEKDEKKASEESKGESDKKIESEKPEDKGPKDQHQQDMSKDKKGAPMESKEGREQEDSKENSKPSEDPHGEAMDHGYDDEDLAHMHSMYSSMSKGELKAHHDSIRKCMDGMAMSEDKMMAKGEMGDAAKDAEGYRPNGGPKDGQAEKEGKGPAVSDMQAMTKSESVVQEIDLLKSELEAVKANSAKEKKDLEAALQKFLTKFVEKTAPAGKAITSLDIIAKTEIAGGEKSLSKSEINEKLLAKSKDFSLSKADRDAINSYYFTKDIQKVSHLLK